MEGAQAAAKLNRPPVKLACLACRSQRVRCDGLETCERCLKTGKQCVYIQSRRGGRRPKPSTADTTGPVNTDAIAIDRATASGHVQPQPEADIYPDLLVGDNDTVFDSLFFNPSYPFTTSLDFLLDGENFRSLGVLRQYRCDHDILDAYYIWIHPTFPALPDPQYNPVDRPLAWTPGSPDELPSHCPSNPLILAILAIVVMIPMPDSMETNTPAMRRQFSSAIATRAYDSITLESQSMIEGSTSVHGPAHPLMGPDIERILALCLLGQYEYLQNGNMEKMQNLTKQALDGAMRLQLHLYLPGAESTFDDARRRAWWTVYLCACNVTIVACVPPIIPLKDPASLYTTPYPQSGNWETHVKAERLLVLATLFLVNLIREFGNSAEMNLIRKSMQTLDAEICRSLDELRALDPTCPPSFHIKVALIRLHSARIKVHRYCALLDDDNDSLDAIADAGMGGSTPVVSDISSDTVLPTSSTSALNPSAGSSTSSRHFPFSSTHSMRCCLQSAHTISQALPDLATIHMPGTDFKFYTFTPFACPIMLAGYTFLMLRHKADTSGSACVAGPGGREMPSECERGAALCMEVLDGFSQAWLHLSDAAMHMKEAAKSL